MSFLRNISINYASQIYVTLISLVMLPMYVKYMGAEAYGLIGFFAMMQGWFILLDMGLSLTLSRETARFRGGATDATTYRRIVRVLEIIFLVNGLVGGGAIFFGSDFIAHNWLQPKQLPVDEVRTAIRLMAFIFAMRWMCGLYRSTISGSEQWKWLSVYSMLIATLHFVVVLPMLMFVGATPTFFFGFQCGVSVIELTVIVVYAYRLLPEISHAHGVPWNLTFLKPIFKFSMTQAFGSSIWVMILQVDKMLLSKILPLAEYGYFTMAVLVASGVSLASSPINYQIVPRLVKLEAENNYVEMIRAYRQATQLVVVVSGAACVTLAFNAELLLWAWTGDSFIVNQPAMILILYAIGNGILLLTVLPNNLLFAKGDLRLPVIEKILFALLFIPSIVWAANLYAGVGAGYVWLAMNFLVFIAWTPLIHRKLAPGLNSKWYFHDIGIIVLAELVVGYSLSNLFPLTNSRWMGFAEVVATGLLVILAGTIASSDMRGRAKDWLMLRQQRP